MLDYIYLLLILVLIVSILFIINISYAYRESSMESFVNLELNEFPKANTNHIPKLNAFLDNYNNLISNTHNRQVISDNKDNVELNKQLIANLDDTNKLLQLKKGIEPVPQTFPIDKLIKTIKSNYNSQYLSLFANDINKYGILVNDKCMTINGLCKDEYCLQQCQNNLYTSDSQKFYTDRIHSADDITRIMKIPKNKVNNKNVYPFNIFRSKVNDKCLSINNDGITVDNCNLNSINQQWTISPNENICLLN